MTPFVEVSKKGIAKTMLEGSLDPERLSLHVTEIPAGTRSHAPHIHAGVEAFFVLEGSGTIETEGQLVPIGTNEVVILDPSKLHGIANTGSVPMKYVVVLSKP
jgi:(S)-ureidoglycine aminohydrolase